MKSSKLSVLQALNAALQLALERDPTVIVLGEDILDPYGGAFKMTAGLSTRFPERVMTTPISEGGIVGVANGLALRGLRPVVEIMFGDFVTLTADQVINHAAKFRGMYNDQVRVPMVIRAPMGGRRGYGPTHSQTLEKLFLGIPGLRVLAPSALGDPGELLLKAVLEDDDPVLFVENKLLYLLPVNGNLDEFVVITSIPHLDNYNHGRYANAELRECYAPAYTMRVSGAPQARMTLAAYGYMVELARQAALKLAYEEEIFIEVVALTQLSPFAISPILDSVEKTGGLLAIEEGTYNMGWGAEILARSSERLGTRLKKASRLATKDTPIPASGKLEEVMLPGVEDIVSTVRRLVNKL